MGLLFRQPTIEGDERQECLNYYEEELKLGLLRMQVDELFGKGMMKYGQLALQNREDGLEGMLKVNKHVSQIASDIVKRKKEMNTVPSVASVMSSAWEVVYSDYEALAEAQADATQADYDGVAADWKRLQELAAKAKKSLRKALKEENKFLKGLKLGSDETQRILDNASKDAELNKWLQDLEEESM